MAISIDWPTKVINIPKADLTLIQSTPIEIRELNLNTFRLNLKLIEESEEGMPFLDTHRHNTTVDIGGVTLAHVVEIINGYTITFENGSYAVNLVGANSNVGDVLNLNTVQVRSANSAGLVQSREIEYAAFREGVTVDPNSSTSGTLYPSGTTLAPVNNLSDALLIANLRGLVKIYLHDDITIDSGNDFTGFIFEGLTPNVAASIDTNAVVTGCTFKNLTVAGTLDGNALLENCTIDNLDYIYGTVRGCGLRGTITLGGANQAAFINCYDDTAGSAIPTIDMGGSGQSLIVRNYNGGLELTNKTGTDGVSLEVDPGRIVLGATVTAGEILIRGVGKYVDNGTTADVDFNELLNPETVAQRSAQGIR